MIWRTCKIFSHSIIETKRQCLFGTKTRYFAEAQKSMDMLIC